MTTQVEQTSEEREENYRRARDLRSAVESWVSREFNFIELEVYEKLNEYLFESIRQSPVEDYIEDFADSLSEEDLLELIEESIDNQETNLKQFILEEKEDLVREFISDNGYDCDNYPMWSTLFEFRSSSIPEEWITKAQEVGLGVIDAQDHFNVTLFASSAGHSFYSAYWIPLYLSIFESERIKYANIDFNMV